MNNYIFTACLFAIVVFTSISGKGINSKWISSWRTERESSLNQQKESQDHLAGGYFSKEPENRKQNEYVEKIEKDRASSVIICLVTTAYSTDIERCPGSCYKVKLKHIAIVGCSRTKHPTWSVNDGEFVWEYCNTGFCNAFE